MPASVPEAAASSRRMSSRAVRSEKVFTALLPSKRLPRGARRLLLPTLRAESERRLLDSHASVPVPLARAPALVLRVSGMIGKLFPDVPDLNGLVDPLRAVEFAALPRS